jgi:hypothetical protein
LNSGNACYHLVQNLPSFLLSKNVKIRMYKTIILPVALYGCEIWSLTLRGVQGLRVFENRVLRICGPKSDAVTGGWKKLLARVVLSSIELVVCINCCTVAMASSVFF